MDNSDLKEILSAFLKSSENLSVAKISQGYINETYVISENDAPKYVLQKINSIVFPDIGGLMDNLRKALPYLHAADYSEIPLVFTKDKKPFYQDEDTACWRLIGFVPDSVAYLKCQNRKQASEAGRILGRFHQLLLPAKLEDFRETLPGFHNLELRRTQFENAVDKASDSRRKMAKEAIIFVRNFLSDIGDQDYSRLPLRLCHNDTKFSNILFSKKTGKALCLVDLDTIMPGYFHYDFGDAIRTVVNTAEEEEKDHSKITFRLPWFDAFLEGMRPYLDHLTQREKQLLPFGVVLMPLLHGLRALTDFLENDRHYRVSYAEQNLDRCKNLFQFVVLANSNKEAMANSVEALLS